jgi:hypothetical protein
MYLKDDKIVATIGNVVMRSSRLGHAREYILDPTAVVGWLDGTAVRRDSTIRLSGSGDFPEKGKMSSRLISFSGTAIAASIGDLQVMRDEFVGLLADGEYQTLSVETQSATRFATVALEEATSWVQQGDTVAVWRITLYAPDPFIYGPEKVINLGATTSVAGGLDYPLDYPISYNLQGDTPLNITVTNLGNVAAWPKFVVTGPYYSGFTVSDGRDRKVVYNGVVSRTSPVTIDMARGTALQGGVDKTTLVSVRDWFPILPGEVMAPEFIPIQAASGYCDIIVRDTYV